jgi:hypothetical protein
MAEAISGRVSVLRGEAQATFEKITLPTRTQRRAFELIDAPIPLTLK